MLQQDLRVQPSSLSRLPMRSCLLFASSSVEHVERCWRVLCKCHLQHRARHPHYRSNHSSTVKQTLVVHLMKLTAPQKNLYVTNTFLFSSTPDSPLPLCSCASVSSGNGLNLLCLSQDSQVGDTWKVVPTAHFLSLFPAMLSSFGERCASDGSSIGLVCRRNWKMVIYGSVLSSSADPALVGVWRLPIGVRDQRMISNHA